MCGQIPWLLADKTDICDTGSKFFLPQIIGLDIGDMVDYCPALLAMNNLALRLARS
ncbi:MAG: hypothetical protein ACON5P_00145 [Candidatus Puniceispirillaceae bacterium]